MQTQQARDFGRYVSDLATQGGVEVAYAWLMMGLQPRTPFRILDVIGQAIARTPVKKYIARCHEARRGPAKKRGQPKKVAPQAATGSRLTSA